MKCTHCGNNTTWNSLMGQYYCSVCGIYSNSPEEHVCSHLQQELSKALELLHGYCPACAHYTCNHREGKCADCQWDSANPPCLREYQDDNWTWCGATHTEKQKNTKGIMDMKNAQRYMVIFCDGFNISNEGLFSTEKEASQHMKECYDKYIPDNWTQEYKEMSSCTDTRAILYYNGEDVYNWGVEALDLSATVTQDDDIEKNSSAPVGYFFKTEYSFDSDVETHGPYATKDEAWAAMMEDALREMSIDNTETSHSQIDFRIDKVSNTIRLSHPFQLEEIVTTWTLLAPSEEDIPVIPEMFALLYSENTDMSNPTSAATVRFFNSLKNAQSAMEFGFQQTNNILHLTEMTPDDDHYVCQTEQFIEVCNGADSMRWEIKRCIPEDNN